jgi:hypothetical protein
VKLNILKRIDALLESQREGHHIPPGKEGEGEECTCLCCGTVYHGNFCPVCGQSSKTRRLSMSDIVGHVVMSLAKFDGRLMHTIRDLFTRPGYLIRDYIKGCRAEYIQPVQMLFSLATIYVLLNFLVNIDSDTSFITIVDEEMADEQTAAAKQLLQWAKEILQFINSNKALSALIGNLVMLLPLKWAFRKTEHGRDLNLTEYFFFLAFIGCQQLLIAMVVMPVGKAFGVDTTSFLSVITALMYLWAYRQFFQISWWSSLWRGLITFLLMLLELFVLILLAGIVVGIVGEMA